MLVTQLLEHFLRGDILPCLGLLGFLYDFEFAEEYVALLLGRGDIEGFACKLVDALLLFVHTEGERF